MQEGRPQQGSIKRVAKSLVNFPAWMGWTELKSNAGLIKRSARALWTIRRPEHEETYKEAVVRLALSEDHLKRRKTH